MHLKTVSRILYNQIAEMSHPLICFIILSIKIMTDFCVLMSLFFLITCLFSDFGLSLSVLFDRSVSNLLDFSIVKSTLDVFITNVFKSVLLVVSSHGVGRTWKIGTYTFPIVWVFFPIRFPSSTMFHHMEHAWVFSSISHSKRKCSKIHRMMKAWEIASYSFSIV